MNKKYTAYVLGPMRGKPFFNFPAFDAITSSLEGAGHEVYNPAQLDREAGFNPFTLPPKWDWSQLPPGLDMQETIKRDVEVILKCDAYVCLEGWEKSTGATAEQKLLVWMGATRLDPWTLQPWVETKAPAPAEAVKGNPKDAFGLKKTPLRLLPWTALCYLAKVMGVGAAKYNPWNWRTDKPRATVYYEAALRHLFAAIDGQDLDEETGLPHTAHVMANMAILIDAQETGSLIDDREKSGGRVAEIMKTNPAWHAAKDLPNGAFISTGSYSAVNVGLSPKPFSVANE
jgi:hypothetical protein